MKQFIHGGIRFPLASASAGRTLLRDADPVVFYLLDYLAWCVRTYAGERLVAEANAAGLAWTDAVAGTSSDNPEPYLKQRQERFPLLAVYRQQSQLSDRTFGKRQDVSSIVVAYVLPPLTGSQSERIGPILNAVKALFDHVCDAGRDPDYTPPNGSAGASLLDGELAGLADLVCSNAQFGAFAGTDDLVFPAVMMTVQTTETAELDDSDLPEFLAEAHIDTQDALGETTDLAVSTIGPPPHTSAVTPALGSKAGGTVASVFGENFAPGVEVLFQGALAELIEFESTLLTVRVPPLAARFSGPPTFAADVTVRLPDGRAARLPAAFLYTD